MELKMKIIAILIASVIISLLIPTMVFANSTPVYLEQYPSFSIAPMKDAPVKVDREKLTFRIDKNSSREAMVTAEYTLSNTSNEKISVPMIFPFVSYGGYSSFVTEIKYNGKAVGYEEYIAGYVNVRDYLKEPEVFNQQIEINKIIDNMNQALYEAKNFDDGADATLYEVTFKAPADRRYNISFHIDTDKTRILIFGFSGFEINSNGVCTVSTFIHPDATGGKGYILVLGEDTLVDITGDHNDSIDKLTVNTRDFMIDQIVKNEDSWYRKENRSIDNFYAMLIKEIDSYFENNQVAFSHNMVIENVLYKNNISALLYEVDFEADSTNTLTITYPMMATMDRRNTSSYINTFAYILNPAKNFSEFVGIDIEIELNTEYPYIIESSIPLNEVKLGSYAVSLDGLPDEDLVFSTYDKEEITILDNTKAQFQSFSYGALMIGYMMAPLFLVVLLIILTRWIVNKTRKNI